MLGITSKSDISLHITEDIVKNLNCKQQMIPTSIDYQNVMCSISQDNKINKYYATSRTRGEQLILKQSNIHIWSNGK